MMRAHYPHRYIGTTQTVSYSASAARTTNGVGAQTRVVRIICTTAAFVAMGGSTFDATTANAMYLAAAREEYFTIGPGQYVSAIRATADGAMYVSEME